MARRDGTRTAAPRWRRRPDLRPRQILEAAAKVFSREGLRGATLDQVAREAGITKGTIYLYFRDKDHLFVAALRERSDRVLKGLEAAGGRASPGTFPARLRRFLEGAYGTITLPETLGTIRMVIGESERFPDTARLFFEEIILRNNLTVQAALERARDEGALRRDLDAFVAARCLMGMLIAFAITQELLGGEKVHPLPRRRILDAVAEVFLRGVAAGGSRRPPAAGRVKRRSS